MQFHSRGMDTIWGVITWKQQAVYDMFYRLSVSANAKWSDQKQSWHTMCKTDIGESKSHDRFSIKRAKKNTHFPIKPRSVFRFS